MDAVTTKEIKSKKQHMKGPLSLAAPAGPGPHCLCRYHSLFNKPSILELTQSCSYQTRHLSLSGNCDTLKAIC